MRNFPYRILKEPSPLTDAKRKTVIEDVHFVAKYRHAIGLLWKIRPSGSYVREHRLRIKNYLGDVREKWYLQSVKYPHLRVLIEKNDLKTAVVLLRNDIKELREEKKYTQFERKHIYELPTCGGVHIHPNSIINYYHSRILSQNKRPLDKKEYIGIEIETYVPINFDVSAFLPLASDLSITTDGSIRTEKGTTDKEFRLLCTTENYQIKVIFLSEMLRKVGARVNSSCGLHIHLDMRNKNQEDLARIHNNLVRYQYWFYKMIPESRRKNDYCRKSRFTALHKNMGRYHAINSESLSEHGSIEVRLHSGTTQAYKINFWIQFLLAVCRADLTLRVPTSLEGLQNRLNLSDALTVYIARRIKKFENPENEETDIESEAEMAVA